MRSLPKQSIIIGLLLAGTTLAFYVPTLRYEFVQFDDESYVFENPHVTSGITVDNIVWAFTTFHAANWHPLTWISLMADARGESLHPGNFHLTNAILHALNTMLLFWLFVRMTGERWPSALVALLFGLHPLHVESVAWVAERKDVLSTFFGLLSIDCYVRYAANRHWLWYAVSLLLFLFSLMSKQMLVTLPALLLLIDYWPLCRSPLMKPKGDRLTFSERSWGPLLVEKIPFILLSGIFCVVVVYAQQSGSAVRSLSKYPFSERLLNGSISYGHYLASAVCPTRLAFFYPYPDAGERMTIGVGVAAGLLIFSIAAIAWRRRFPFVAVGWFWFLGTLLPVIGIIQVGDQAFADRYMYVPLIGLTIILAWSLVALTHARPILRIASVIFSSLIVTACAILTAIQIPVWRNSETLFKHAISVTGQNLVAHAQLGMVYKNQHRIPEAIEQYERVVAIRPDAFEHHGNLGLAYLSLREDEKGIMHLREAVRLRPDDPFVLNNLAWTLSTSPSRRFYNPAEGVRLAERAIASDQSGHPGLLDTLAVAYAGAGRFDDAIRTATKARDIAKAHGIDQLVQSQETRLALYRRGKPYRIPDRP